MMNFRTSYNFRPLTMGVHIVNPVYADFEQQGMVTLSYDDGYMDNYTVALRLHERYRLPGTFNVITRHSGGHPFLNLDRMKKREIIDTERRGAEIASHSHTHPVFTDLTPSQIEYELLESYSVLSQWVQRVETIAIPGSQYNSEAKVIVEGSDFNAARVHGNVYNQYGSIDKYWLTSHSVGANTTFSEVKAVIDGAISGKHWCIIMLHRIVQSNPVGTEITAELLDQILAYIASFPKEDLLCVNTRDGVRFALGLGDFVPS